MNNPDNFFNNFKSFLIDQFPHFNNHLDNYSLGISAKQLEMNLYKYDSFQSYLNNISAQKQDEELVIFLKENMNKDFNLKLPLYEDDDFDSNFNDGLTDEQNKKFEKIFNENKNKFFEKDIQRNKLENMIKNLIKDTFNEYININQYSNLKQEISEILKISISKQKEVTSTEIFEKLKKLEKNPNLIQNPIQFIESIKENIDELINIQRDNEILQSIRNKYQETLKLLDETVIRIITLGLYSSGKSSLLNNIIGYNLNLLQVNENQCTKLGLIIKYTKEIEDISLYKANIEKINGKLFFKEGDLIAYGDNDVRFNISLINQTNNTEISNISNDGNNNNFQYYYILKTPI